MPSDELVQKFNIRESYEIDSDSANEAFGVGIVLNEKKKKKSGK